MACTGEPEIPGRDAEKTLQLAVRREVEAILERARSRSTVGAFFVLERFGLDLAVFLAGPNGRTVARLLELKAFVGSRQGGV